MDLSQALPIIKKLIGFQLIEFSNILGTWVCEFRHPELKDFRYKWFLECPWRIIEHSTLKCGSDDLRFFWEEFPDNMGASPFGGILVEVLGLETFNGGLVSKRVMSIVDVKIDSVGQVSIVLTGGLSIELLPAGHFDVQWILSDAANCTLTLKDGVLEWGQSRSNTVHLRCSDPD
jgi:hypothetical protein